MIRCDSDDLTLVSKRNYFCVFRLMIYIKSQIQIKGAVSSDAHVRDSHLNLKRQPNFLSLHFQYGVVNQSPD